jgi:hypothetical protein
MESHCRLASLSIVRETNVAASYTLIASCASFVNTYATPVALEKIQWKVRPFVFAIMADDLPVATSCIMCSLHGTCLHP